MELDGWCWLWRIQLLTFSGQPGGCGYEGLYARGQKGTVRHAQDFFISVPYLSTNRSDPDQKGETPEYCDAGELGSCTDYIVYYSTFVLFWEEDLGNEFSELKPVSPVHAEKQGAFVV